MCSRVFFIDFSFLKIPGSEPEYFQKFLINFFQFIYSSFFSPDHQSRGPDGGAIEIDDAEIYEKG